MRQPLTRSHSMKVLVKKKTLNWSFQCLRSPRKLSQRLLSQRVLSPRPRPQRELLFLDVYNSTLSLQKTALSVSGRSLVQPLEYSTFWVHCKMKRDLSINDSLFGVYITFVLILKFKKKAYSSYIAAKTGLNIGMNPMDPNIWYSPRPRIYIETLFLFYN